MLTIQPVSTNSYNRPVRVNFKGWEDDISQGRQTIEDGQRALNEILNDTQVPDKLKKPVKFFKVLTNAALEGLAVFGSVMILGDFLKKGKGNKVVQQAAEKAKPIYNKTVEYAKNLGKLLQKGTEQAKNTSLGKKVMAKLGEFFGTMKGKRILVYARKCKRQLNKILEKVLSPIKNLNGDKATKSIATVLGIGSGATGAYEATMTPEERSPEMFDEVEE